MAKNRKLFEEVGAGAAAPQAPQGGMIDAPRRGARRAIRLWLVALFALVLAMIVVGGLTRLTDSGLSITEWRPVTGAIPPLSEADWAAEFDKYRASPEYQLQNRGMSLEAFKVIYWWEWGHRQLGRLVGLVWAAGFAGFWAARRIPPGWAGRLLGLGALGAAQGVIGWWMVASGLDGRVVDVASYRLATHLGIAFVILGLIAWYVFLLGRDETDLIQARRLREARLLRASTGLMHFAFLQILLGALVAGIDAGRAFPTWPDMGGAFLPPEMFGLTPWWRNFFENAGTVQFIHRMAGYLLLVLSVVVWLRARRSPHPASRMAFAAILGVMVLQVVLGIVTALYSAPLHAALSHQIGAMLLWVLVLRGRYLARYPLTRSVRG